MSGPIAYHKPTKDRPLRLPEWVKRVNAKARKLGNPPLVIVRILKHSGDMYTFKRQYTYRDPVTVR